MAAMDQACLPEAMDACMAMNPEDLPMSLTSPTPLNALLASTYDQQQASYVCVYITTAAHTILKKPQVDKQVRVAAK